MTAVLAASAFAQHDASPVGEQGFLGVLASQEEIVLASLMEGRLLRVGVRIGDDVPGGTVVAEIDDRAIRQELARAAAELDGARASRAEAATRLSMAEETLTQRESLVAEGIVSQDQVREAKQGVQLAHASLERADASIREREASLGELGEKLAQTRIVAPFTGTVAQRYGNPGMTVEPGTPLLKLIGMQGLWARFAVPLDQAHRLTVGGSVSVYVRDVDLTTNGAIRHVGSEVDSASGMIICEARVDTPAGWRGPPLAGQPVRVRLIERAGSDRR